MTDETRYRLWIWAGRGLIAFLMVGALAAITAGLDWWVAIVVIAVGAFVLGLLVDPRRPWWGPEPKRVADDPERMAAYRRTEIKVFAVMFVLLIVASAALGIVTS